MNTKQNTILKAGRSSDEWENYNPSRVNRFSEPTVSINPKGECSFSASFRDIAKIRDYKYCKIKFMADPVKVALQFGYKPEDRGHIAVTVTHTKQGNSKIRLTSLFKRYGVDLNAVIGSHLVHKENIPKEGLYYVFDLETS